MKELSKTLIFTLMLSFAVIVMTVFIQITGQNAVKAVECSYLDPITIDLLAFIVALFLIVEGFSKIFENPKSKIRNQFTRSIRIAMGFAILTIHIIQFIHK